MDYSWVESGSLIGFSAGERQALFDPIFVGRMDQMRATEAAAASGRLSLHQMPPTCARAQHFATGSDFEPFGYRFLGLDSLRASHN
jgi:hypothetical protein